MSSPPDYKWQDYGFLQEHAEHLGHAVEWFRTRVKTFGIDYDQKIRSQTFDFAIVFII